MMWTTRTTDELKDEHRVIEQVLEFYQGVAKAAEADRDLPVDSLRDAIQFTRLFADQYHHGKEERILFERLEQAGMPREGGPMGVMLKEHAQGRGYVASLTEAVERYARSDRSAATDISRAAQSYADLVAQHIYKEENILYVMADQLLSNEDEQVVASYRGAEGSNIGDEQKQRLVEMASRLREEAKRL